MGDAKRPNSAPSLENRLDSWKEIAAYLDRDVSTAKRWEKKEGLPVHRHIHKSQGRVYAFPGEIDAWLVARSQKPRPPALDRRALGRLAAAAALLGLSLGSVFLWFAQTPPASSDPDPTGRPRVLVADFENHSGQELFDDTLQHAVSSALSESGAVHVVSRLSIGDVLAQMKLPQDTVVDTALAREISLRDGEIAAVVSGRVERLESSYRITASLFGPADGTTDATTSFEIPVDQPRSVLSVVGDLTDWIRPKLTGTASRLSSPEKLEPATTESLEALQLYSKAMQLCYRDEWGPAEPLLRGAVQKDPGFASAHIMLAWVLRNQIPILERPSRLDEYIEPARRALALSETLSEPERLWIQASHRDFLGEFEKAADLYAALVSLRDDHYWGTNNLAHHYRRRVRHGVVAESLQKAIRYQRLKANLRPQEPFFNYWAATRLGLHFSDLESAEIYRQRALALLPEEPSERWYSRQATLILMPSFAGLLEGRPEPALEALDRLAERWSMAAGPSLAGFYLNLGKLSQARELFRSESAPSFRGLGEIVVAYAAGQRERFVDAVRHHWGASSTFEGPLKPVLLARAGRIDDAIALLERVGPHTPLNATTDLMDTARGVVALLSGDESRGVELLEQALSCPAVYASFLIGAEVLADHYASQGRQMDALRVLERAHLRTHATMFYGEYYARIQVQLLRLLRETGRLDQKAELEEKMRQRWALADPDHPALVALDREPTLR